MFKNCNEFVANIFNDREKTVLQLKQINYKYKCRSQLYFRRGTLYKNHRAQAL